jgi:uncharacterized protein DUF5666
MLGKLILLVKSKLALAVVGTVLVAGGGATVALASTGAHVLLVSQAQTSQSIDTDASDDHVGAQKQDGNSQQVEGSISSIDAGHTSFVVMPVQGTAVTVVVNAQTVFEEGLQNFAGLKVGMDIEAKGTRQADGSLLATKVEGRNENANENDAQDDNESELKGTIGNINAANSTFVLQLAGGATKTVQVSAQTEFDGGFRSLADLKAGLSVEVRGNLQSNGTLAATRIRSEDTSAGNDHGGSGSGSDDGGGR